MGYHAITDKILHAATYEVHTFRIDRLSSLKDTSDSFLVTTSLKNAITASYMQEEGHHTHPSSFFTESSQSTQCCCVYMLYTYVYTAVH